MKNSSKQINVEPLSNRRERVDSLERQIEQLRTAATGRNLGLYRAMTPSGYNFASGFSPLVGIGSDNRLHLLLPVKSLRTVREDHDSSGVVIVGRELLDGGRRQAFADLECREIDLSKTYILLVEEVLASLENASAEPVEVAHQVLRRWRDLLVRPPTDRLSTGALAGLLGELLLIADSPAPPKIFDCWSGPSRIRHDFQIGKLAIEVKTTLSADGQSVTVHGLSQLEPPNHGVLLLVRYRLEKSSVGTSVCDVLDRISASGVESSRLYGRLLQAGYSREEEAFYSNQRFTVRAREVWKVADAFPSITARSFVGGGPPPGTRVLEYELDLSVAQSWHMADDEFAAIMEGAIA